MNKIYGRTDYFMYVRQDYKRTIVNYDMVLEPDPDYATWWEIVYSPHDGRPTFEKAKNDILADINARTDAKILTGFTWKDMPVWLSTENQFNYKAAYDLAIQSQGASLPVKFKLGEDAEENPVYYTFETMEDFTDFYTSAIAYVNQTLNEGWEHKDSMDWTPYEEALNPIPPNEEEPEEQPKEEVEQPKEEVEEPKESEE